MAPFKGYWMAAAYCPGVTDNDMVVADFCKKVGGTPGTSGTGGRSGTQSDLLTDATGNDLHNSNGTPKANATAIQTYFPNRILVFPRPTLEAWWPGSGWWPDYTAGTGTQGTTIDTNKLDQIAKAVPDGTLLCTDNEYSFQCPGPWDTQNPLLWQQDAVSEARAIADIGMEGAAFTYFKLKCSILGKPNVKLFKYAAYPFTQALAAGYQFNRDSKGTADYPPVSDTYPLGGYAALCDRIDRAFTWAVAQGAFSSQVCDGLIVDAYLPYNDTQAANNLGAGWTGRTVLAVKGSRDAKLLAQLKVPCYANILALKSNNSGVPVNDGAGNIALVTTEQFQAMIDYACAGYDGVIWHSITHFETYAALASGNFTQPAFDTAIEPYGPANYFVTAQSIATR